MRGVVAFICPFVATLCLSRVVLPGCDHHQLNVLDSCPVQGTAILTVVLRRLALRCFALPRIVLHCVQSSPVP